MHESLHNRKTPLFLELLLLDFSSPLENARSSGSVLERGLPRLFLVASLLRAAMSSYGKIPWPTSMALACTKTVSRP